jgi:4-amino-4-deoxy-L-arabinose transferase-like glycosyltransferase
VGALVAIAVVCVPFLIADAEAMVRQVVVDQLSRPSMGVGLVTRMRAIEGIGIPTGLGLGTVRVLFAVAAAAAGAALVAATAWRVPGSRLWAGLGVVQVGVVLVTPTFFPDYPSFAAPALALVIGAGLATAVGAARDRGVRVTYATIPIVLILGALATASLMERGGDKLQLADMTADVAAARCVATNRTALLILTSAFRANLEAGCGIVVDPQGLRYETDRGSLRAGLSSEQMRAAAGFQRAMIDLYTTSDAALFLGSPPVTLAPGTVAALEAHLPTVLQRGPIRVFLVMRP